MGSIIVDLDDELSALRDLLANQGERLVLVESCTAGMTSGLLGQIPGISNYLCGSMVVYRNDSKRQWLGIDPTKLDNPNIGPVSKIVTQELAVAALELTPEATLAAAVTGHLGPEAPSDLDGRVFTCIVRRQSSLPSVAVEHQLTNPPPRDRRDWSARQIRQIEAARIVFSELRIDLMRLTLD